MIRVQKTRVASFIALPALVTTAVVALLHTRRAAATENAATGSTNEIKKCHYSGSSLNNQGIFVTYEFDVSFGSNQAKANEDMPHPRFDPERIRYAATVENLPADGLGFFFTANPPARLLAPTECFDQSGGKALVPISQQELDNFQLEQAINLWTQSDAQIPRPPSNPRGPNVTAKDCARGSCPLTKILPLMDSRFDALAAKMKKLTLGDWGCPVARDGLSYLWVSHRDNSGRTAIGEIIVATPYAAAVAKVFAELYANNFPIERMRTQDYFQGEDSVSMAANNTSGFRCPKSDQGGEHPLGQAIDLNPLQNPFIKPNERKFNPDRGFENPPPASLEQASQRYAIEPLENWSLAFWLNRQEQSSRDNVAARQIILPNSLPVRAFDRIGWAWGGKWNCCADYQHFSKDNT